MRSIGWLRDEAARLAKKVTRLEAGRTALWERHSKDIERAGQHRVMSDVLGKMEEARGNVDKLHDRFIGSAKAELDRVRSDLESRELADREAQTARAGEAEVSAKRLSQQSWIASGGDPSKFEKEWPSMYRDLLLQRTADAERARQSGVNVTL